MANFSIIPFKGTEEMEFGMSPEQIRRNLGSRFLAFKRSEKDVFPTDYFEEVGVFCYYNETGNLNAIEFTRPADPTLNGIRFIGMGFDAAKSEFISMGQEIEEETDAAIAFGLGISIYAPLAKESPSAPVETVLVFREGYYP